MVIPKQREDMITRSINKVTVLFIHQKKKSIKIKILRGKDKIVSKIEYCRINKASSWCDCNFNSLPLEV